LIIFALLWLALGGLTLLIAAATVSERNAVPMEMMILLVLGAGMLIAPSLSATSINGDSGRHGCDWTGMVRAGRARCGRRPLRWLTSPQDSWD